MLTKNIYILYPAGYSGSYISWAINISDKDLYSSTVKNPVNESTSAQFGGQGTSHNHVRIPTHQGIYQHLSWVIYNRPTDKKIYVINDGSDSVYSSIVCLMRADPDGVFIIVHNNNDPDVDAYGTINCITKWPTYSAARLWRHTLVNEKFSWTESTRTYRNFIVNNHSKFFLHMEKTNYNTLTHHTSHASEWYTIRNNLQPHEVNELTYVANFNLDNRIFDISCADVASNYFPQWLENFMNDSAVSDAYDCQHASNYHDNYINAQPNLKWFDSIKEWEDTGKLNSYLTSHCGIEAHVILRIFKNSNRPLVSVKQQSNWIESYNSIKDPSWPAVTHEHDFYALPEWIQNEILTQHGYKLNVAGVPNSTILNFDWENVSTEEINQVYQDTKQK